MKKAYILKDKERYIIANDKNGSERIILEIDYHQKKASIFTMSCPNYPQYKQEFVFAGSSPEMIETIGYLIAEAGKEAKRKLLTNAEYEIIK